MKHVIAKNDMGQTFNRSPDDIPIFHYSLDDHFYELQTSQMYTEFGRNYRTIELRAGLSTITSGVRVLLFLLQY